MLLEIVRIISVQFHNSVLLFPSVLAGTDYFSWQGKFHPRLSFPKGSQKCEVKKKAISFLTAKVFGKEFDSKATPKALG